MSQKNATQSAHRARLGPVATALLGLSTLGLVATADAARADAIDGDWCFATQNLNIQGPKIRIPSGIEIVGAYTRHSFEYTVPDNEPEAGKSIAMQLFGEELMQLTRAGGAPEMWRRCKPVS